MRTFYYVNGKRTNLEGYLRAGDTSKYHRDALQKALSYFEKNPLELRSVGNVGTEEMLAKILIMQYELTSEGQSFYKEWHDKNEKSLRRAYVIGTFLFLSIVMLAVVGIFYNSKPSYLEKYKTTRDNVSQGENALTTFSTKAFSIQYPGNWELTEGDLGVIRVKSKTDNMSFTIVQFDPKISFVTIRQTRDPIKKDKGYEVVEKRTIKVDGTDVFETIYSKTSNNQGQTIMSYLFSKDGIVYDIEFENCYSSNSKKIVHQIIKTLHLKNN